MRSCFFEGTETSNAEGAGSGPILYDWGSTFCFNRGMANWTSLKIFQDLSFFKKNYSRSIVDYYPKNLAKTGDKPYLREMGSVMDEFVNVPTKESPNFEERYDHFSIHPLANDIARVHPNREHVQSIAQIHESR